MPGNSTNATVTYCGNVSQKIENYFSKYNIQIAFKRANIKYNIKEFTQKLDKSGVYTLEFSEYLHWTKW